MSIHTKPIPLLLNSLAADTVVVSGGILTIKGLPPINIDNITNCTKQCPTACTKQVTTITPTIPASPCECPYEWELKVKREICYNGRTDYDAIRDSFYSFSDPSGATPTVNDIISSLLVEINSDPYAIVTAAGVGSEGSWTAITLTEKNCDTDPRTCGFKVYFPSGTQTTGTAHVSAKLLADDMLREWGVQPGSFGERPNTALCGVYCRYTIDVDPSGTTRDQNFDNAYVQRKMQVVIDVNSSLANYATDFETEMADSGLACFA